MNIAAIMKRIPPFLRRRKIVGFLLLLFPGSRIQQVELNNGAQLFADISDKFPRTYFLTGNFDQEFLDTARFFLGEGGVYFDAGANLGFYSFGLMAEIPHAKISYHLFEANAEICRQLECSAGLQKVKAVKITECCLADRAGVSKLQLRKGQLSGSFISENGTQPVKNLVLDDYILENKISKVDFLKMDIEGYEFPALKGLSKSMDRGIIKVIYLEVSCPNHLNRQWKAEDTLELLRAKGFKLFYVRAEDFKKGWASESMTREWTKGSRKLKVSPLETFPSGHQTDILAVHASAEGVVSC